MFCPCCAGRTVSSIRHLDQSGNVDGGGRSLAPNQFETLRTSEPYNPRIPGDLLSVPLPAITDLPVEFVRHILPNWIYNTRIQRHAIWDYLSLSQICGTYAERLLLENDHKLSHLYSVEEGLGGPRVSHHMTDRGNYEPPGGARSGHDRYPRDGRYWQGDNPQQQPWFG